MLQCFVCGYWSTTYWNCHAKCYHVPQYSTHSDTSCKRVTCLCTKISKSKLIYQGFLHLCPWKLIQISQIQWCPPFSSPTSKPEGGLGNVQVCLDTVLYNTVYGLLPNPYIYFYTKISAEYSLGGSILAILSIAYASTLTGTNITVGAGAARELYNYASKIGCKGD